MPRTRSPDITTIGLTEKNNFLADADTQRFIAWLAGVIGGQNIHFTHGTGIDQTLADAKARYAWPAHATMIPVPGGERVLKQGSTLKQNQDVLAALSQGLKDCLAKETIDADELRAWMKAVFIWGGVYTDNGKGGGNVGWLNANTAELPRYLPAVLTALTDGSGTAVKGLGDGLRSNAGTTKVHSLIMNDFIIYDSRVAASLAWLVLQWVAAGGLDDVPQHLRFACMRAKQTPKQKKIRSPDQKIFPYIAVAKAVREHRKHAIWNVRASWILSEALSKRHAAGPCAHFATVRDVEAALFMMGANLSHALY
jgi:hypothetical protein